MNQKIAFTINSNNNFGCVPECVVLDNDNQNKPSTSFVKLSRQNIERYNHLLDKTDLILVDCCFKLEKETIVSKITDKSVRSWESLIENYFDPRKNHKDTQFIRDYVTDYINQYQNRFFENITDKKIYQPVGNFPFMWKQLFVELEMPEVYYCFEKKEDGLYFSLDLSCKSRNLDLNKAILVSRKTARVLVDNKIYEFDNEVDGAKLIPFLTKNFVHIPPQHIEDYLQKIVIPLISTNRVLTDGFSITTVNELTKAVFRVKEIRKLEQLSLFTTDLQTDSTISELLIELIFEYQDF